MTWTQNTDRSWLHTGATREVVIGRTAAGSIDALGQLGSLWFRVANKTSNLKAILCADPSGTTCWEAGIEGANAVIRKVTLGAAAAASATAAHLIGASTPFYMRVDLEGTVIKVFLNGVTPAIVTHDIAADSLVSQSGYGFTSSVNNALVLQAFKAPLVPNVLPSTKILVWVANGDIWYAKKDPVTGIPTAALAKARALAGGTQPISGTEYHQKVLLCDGVGQHKVFNAQTLAVTDWTRTGISDPFFLVQAHQDRVYGVLTTDKQNLYASAVADETDFNAAVGSLGGQSYALTLSGGPKIGEPIRSLFAATRTALVAGCSRSVWELVGDPVLGSFEVNPVSVGIGASGAACMALTPSGMIACHTTDGFAVIAGGALSRVSSGVLTSLIQVEQPLDNYLVSVVRDASLHGCMIFLTPVVPGPAVHLWYDERTGGYAEGTGGFWPEDFPDNIGPTCACDWDGTIVLGGRDGYLRTFDKAVFNRDGVAINWRLPVVLATAVDLDHDTIVQQLTIVRADDSGEFNVVLYGGRTAEEALAGDSRTLLIRKATTARETVLMPSVRAPAVVVEFSGQNINEQGVLEAVQIVTTPGEVSLFARRPATDTAFGNTLRLGSTQSYGGQQGPGGGGGGGGGSTPGGGIGSQGDVVPSGTAPGGGTVPYPEGPQGDDTESAVAAVFDAGPV